MPDDTDLIPPGTVWLVGAGPGDPDLLTRKAERLIRAATVIFYDALVGPGVLDLIPPHVRRVPVGKRSGRHSRNQKDINELILESALSGERVVRLKGGDPSIFGRSAEEIETLFDGKVRVQVCPGITTASAAAASAGISLSLRGVARRIQFVTAHAQAGEPLDLDWSALADVDNTLAFYMGRAAAREISHTLIAHGLAAETPVILACDVSRPTEHILHTRLDLLPLLARSIAADRPALILVGEATRSRKRAHDCEPSGIASSDLCLGDDNFHGTPRPAGTYKA